MIIHALLFIVRLVLMPDAAVVCDGASANDQVSHKSTKNYFGNVLLHTCSYMLLTTFILDTIISDNPITSVYFIDCSSHQVCNTCNLYCF